ncbi:MAG: flagellar biosynthetic protein FliR [Paracoccus sp. (in: a-proteobacteria)]|nr:flagellar biosynthetic protein FliR [Paracoccus sp. (in: a-proteobacteria)]
MPQELADALLEVTRHLPLDLALAHLPVYVRIQLFLLVMPVFSERNLPVRVRVAAAMALTPLFPAAAGVGAPAAFAALIATEGLIGVLMAMPVRLISLALNIAASAIASVASLSQLLGTGTEASPHPIGNMLHYAGIAVLIALGLPVLMIDMLAASFELFPRGAIPSADTSWPMVGQAAALSFQLAMTISAPFILGGLLYQALLGTISKVMPALPVVFIGSPAAIMLALLGLMIFSPFILSIWADAVFGVAQR